jgi:hypothetical protein
MEQWAKGGARRPSTLLFTVTLPQALSWSRGLVLREECRLLSQVLLLLLLVVVMV